MDDRTPITEEKVTAAIQEALLANPVSRGLFGETICVKASSELANWRGFAYPYPDRDAIPTAILVTFTIRGEKGNGTGSASVALSDRIAINELQVSSDTNDEIFWIVSRLSQVEREQILQEVVDAERDLDGEDCGQYAAQDVACTRTGKTPEKREDHLSAGKPPAAPDEDSLSRETQRLIERLTESQWFSSAGQAVPSTGIVQVDSWGAAATFAMQKKWEKIHLDLFNDLASAVLEHYGEEHYPLDDVGDVVWALVAPVVERQIEAAGIPPHLLEIVRVHTTSDVVLACLECEFRSIASIGLFASLANWYLQGHFPCGWQGKYPKGKLVVF